MCGDEFEQEISFVCKRCMDNSVCSLVWENRLFSLPQIKMASSLSTTHFIRI